MSQNAPTSTKCDHDKRFGGVFFLPKEDRGCLACAFERARRDALRVIMRDRNVVVEQIATLQAVKPRREVGSYQMQYILPEIVPA